MWVDCAGHLIQPALNAHRSQRTDLAHQGRQPAEKKFSRNVARSETYPAAALLALRFPRASIAIYFMIARTT